MNVSARARHEPEAEQWTHEQEATIRAAAAWVQQLARTLKTCRLYDARNPNTARFRQELHLSLQKLIEDHGSLSLRFTSDDVLCEGGSLYPARSRDDNLALPFYRDGVRGLVFSEGIDAREVDAVIDALVQVTGPAAGDDDLVTLLWQAHLTHADIDYVPAEADTGTGVPEGAESVPWPAATPEPEAAETPAETKPSETLVESGSRSDDWSLGETTLETEASFEELDALAPSELNRFHREFALEHAVSPVTASVAIAHAVLSADPLPDERIELARFLPRVLRQAVVQGHWRDATATLELLARCRSPEWSIEGFTQELFQPISVSTTRERLEQQDASTAREFVRFAFALGEGSVDLLTLILMELQNPRHQRLFSEAIIEACRDNPERLAPWLADPRWFVVRGVVQMLGEVGGPSIVGMLQSAAQHPEPRVRHEVVLALRGAEPKHARPLLLRLLNGAETRTFCAALHQLSQARDAGTARLMLQYVLDPGFEKRPIEEKRAVYSALSAAGADDVLPELELELHKGGWFTRHQEMHRQAIARCIARLGTPAARLVLTRGAQSRRIPVRKACEDALGRMSHE